MKQTVFLYFFFIPVILISCTGQNEKSKLEDMTDEVSASEENQNNADYSYLALGDSYTIGESVETDERFPVQLAEKLTKNGFLTDSPEIVAQTGWTTDELAAGIKSSRGRGFRCAWHISFSGRIFERLFQPVG